MRPILIVIFMIGGFCTSSGQMKIRFEDKTLLITKVNTYQNIPAFDLPLHADDDEAVRLFKLYFHAASYETYKSYFLSQDWVGTTASEFQAWQASITENKLYLYQAIYLEDSYHQEYLVLQYKMESEEYTVPASTEFKKISGQWKHTNVQKDDYGALLSRSGLIHPDYIKSNYKESVKVINLEQPQSFTSWTYQEKFNRNQMFEKIAALLKEKQVSPNDVETAKSIFLQKDDVGFIKFIVEKYQFDHMDLMDEINSISGFPLFKFSRPQND